MPAFAPPTSLFIPEKWILHEVLVWEWRTSRRVWHLDPPRSSGLGESTNRPLATSCDWSGPQGNQWAECPIWWPTQWSQRKAPSERARGGGWVGWSSGYWSRTWQTLELACRPRTSPCRSFALYFKFLSFDFFGANKRGREWKGEEEERTVWVLEIFEWGVRYGSHKKVEIFKWCELKTMSKQVGFRKFGYFKWWVM